MQFIIENTFGLNLTKLLRSKRFSNFKKYASDLYKKIVNYYFIFAHSFESETVRDMLCRCRLLNFQLKQKENVAKFKCN